MDLFNFPPSQMSSIWSGPTLQNVPGGSLHCWLQCCGESRRYGAALQFIVLGILITHWMPSLSSMLNLHVPFYLTVHGTSSPMKSPLCFAIENEQQLSIAIWFELESCCAEGTCGTCCEARQRVSLNSALVNPRLVLILVLYHLLP